MKTEDKLKYAKEIDEIMHQIRKRRLVKKENYGIHEAEFHVLMQLYFHKEKEPIRPSELAKRMNVTMAAVTHKINELERLSLITRIPSTEDKRVVYVALTKEGRALVEKRKNDYFERLGSWVDYLGEEDTHSLIRIIGRIRDYVNLKGNEEKSNE